MNTLLIPLVGPMQSWGSRSRFDDRDTNFAPTKSAVVGLVCSALGWSRDKDLSCFATMRFGVRVDCPGRTAKDYQTAQEVIRAKGDDLENVTSDRHFLAGARFLAALEAADVEFFQEIEEALHSPQYALSLGRKSYPLSLPPYLPEGSLRRNTCLEDALAREPWRYLTDAEFRQKPTFLLIVIEKAGGEAVWVDQPESFLSRTFAPRTVEYCYIKTPEEAAQWCTCPN